METLDPRSLTRMIHVVPRRGMWRVKWSDGKRALRWLTEEKQAIRFAKEKSAGQYTVIVHTLSGYADTQNVPSSSQTLLQ